MSAETERFQAIRARWQAATPGPWFETDQPDGVLRVSFVPLGAGNTPVPPPWNLDAFSHYVEFSGDMEDYTGADLSTARAIAAAPTDIATLLAALDAAEARSTALQTALAQTTHGYLHQVGEGTGYTVWHCRLCGDTTFDTHAPNHQSWCPVLVLAESYREE